MPATTSESQSDARHSMTFDQCDPGPPHASVSILGRVVLGRDDEATTLPRAAVDGLDDVDDLLFIRYGPVDLVVVACAKIDHDVLRAHDSKHECERSVRAVCFRRGKLAHTLLRKKNMTVHGS